MQTSRLFQGGQQKACRGVYLFNDFFQVDLALKTVLEQFFFNFCAAHLPVRLDIETKFPYFSFLTWLSIIRNQEFRLYI